MRQTLSPRILRMHYLATTYAAQGQSLMAQYWRKCLELELMRVSYE